MDEEDQEEAEADDEILGSLRKCEACKLHAQCYVCPSCSDRVCIPCVMTIRDEDGYPLSMPPRRTSTKAAKFKSLFPTLDYKDYGSDDKLVKFSDNEYNAALKLTQADTKAFRKHHREEFDAEVAAKKELLAKRRKPKAAIAAPAPLEASSDEDEEEEMPEPAPASSGKGKKVPQEPEDEEEEEATFATPKSHASPVLAPKKRKLAVQEEDEEEELGAAPPKPMVSKPPAQAPTWNVAAHTDMINAMVESAHPAPPPIAAPVANAPAYAPTIPVKKPRAPRAPRKVTMDGIADFAEKFFQLALAERSAVLDVFKKSESAESVCEKLETIIVDEGDDTQ